MTKYALIMAGGEGRRAGDELPKQFHKLLGIPMLWWSVMAFHKADPEIQISVVMHPGFFDEYDIMYSELPEDLQSVNVRLVAGGKNRGHSVRNGILSLPDSKDSLIAVHDAARPLVSTQIINTGFECAIKFGSAVPVVPVSDSLRELKGETSVYVDRNKFVAVQTPQIFRADILKEAYRLEDKSIFTDDASRVQALGYDIKLFDGNPRNIKVTNPIDFSIAETLLEYK